MPTDHRLIETDDGAILSAGVRAGGPTVVVLVHGFTLTASIWDPLAELLVDAGYTVVTYDLRGHGNSTSGTQRPDLPRLVADLATVVTAEDLSDVHLVGHSLGAFVALVARTDPTVAHRLATVTAISGMDRSITDRAQRVAARVFSSRFGVVMLRPAWLGRRVIRPWFGQHPTNDELDAVRRMSARCVPPTRAAIAAATADVDLRPALAQSGVPTLVMCSDDDRATPPANSNRIVEAMDDARLSTIVAAGHMVIVERPDLVAVELTDWIAAHRAL